MASESDNRMTARDKLFYHFLTLSRTARWDVASVRSKEGRTMNGRYIRLAEPCDFFAFVGAIIGYLRYTSFSGMIAGALFFLVVWGIVGLLITDSRSLVKWSCFLLKAP